MIFTFYFISLSSLFFLLIYCDYLFLGFFVAALFLWVSLKPLYRRFLRLYYSFWVYLTLFPFVCTILDKLFLLYSRLFPRPSYDEDDLSSPLNFRSHMDEVGDVGVVCWKGKILFCTYLNGLDYILCSIHRLYFAFSKNYFDYPENRPFELSSMLRLLEMDPFLKIKNFIDPVVPDLYGGYIPSRNEGFYFRGLYHESVDLFYFFYSKEHLKYLFDFVNLVFRRGYAEYPDEPSITRFGNTHNFTELFVKNSCSIFCRSLFPFVYSSFTSYLSEFISSYYFQYAFFKRDFFLCFYLSLVGLILSMFPFSFCFSLVICFILFDFLCFDSNKYFLWFSFSVCFLFSFWGFLIFIFIIPLFIIIFYFFDEFVRLIHVDNINKMNLHKAKLQF